MPIKTLEPFLFENYSVGNCSIDILKRSTIGIDVTHYVTRLLTFKKEPFIELIGGFPLTLLSNMENDLKIFKELQIKPIFVIDGLSTLLNFQHKNSDGLSSVENIRSNKWDLFNKNIKIDTFRDYHTPLKCNIYDILEFFEKNDLEYIVAPYQASQQLYYMLQKNVIDTIYGSTDLLLYPLPLEKFIFCIEFQNREFKYLDKQFILNRLNLTEKQFMEISMCVGNGYQPFNLNVFQPSNNDVSFQQLHDFVVNGAGSIHNLIIQLRNLQDHYFKGISSLKFLPILTLDGTINILKVDLENKVPNDLHEFVGQRLSNEYYYYQSMGITNFKPLETVLHGTYLERLSLDSNPHKFYLEIINDVELTNKILNLTTNFLARYFQFKKYDLKLILPNNQTQVLELSSRQTLPLYLQTRKFLYKDSTNDSFVLDSFLTGLKEHLKINKAALTDDLKLSNNNEILSSSIARSLYVLEVLNGEGGLGKYETVLPFVKSKELLLILIFFLKFQTRFKKLDLGCSTKFELLAKFLSIYHISNIKPQNYTSTISQSLLQFNSVFSKLQEKFNELIMSNVLTILFGNEFGKKFEYTRHQWYKLSAENPFNKLFNSTLLGLIGESFFNMYNGNGNNLQKTIDQLNNNWSYLFLENESPYKQLTKGLEWFHSEVAVIVAKLGDLGVVSNDVAAFVKEADDWLTSTVLV